jgi:hypothetical protein
LSMIHTCDEVSSVGLIRILVETGAYLGALRI